MTAKEYLELPYNINIRHITDESGSYYFATVLELDGCMSDGESYEDALKNIREAMEGWFETNIANGLSVPQPFDAAAYSGKFLVRIPKTLHAKLSIAAQKEGVSLNQYALYKLST
ncbi:pilus biosynthesis protein HicB [Spirochaetia bacterium]|nr:pilus biosynthesis protein HicB [Spirochaetia bacterium]